LSVTVRIPTPLRRLTNGQAKVEACGTNLIELVADLEARYPGIKERLCDEQGQIKRFVNVFVNGQEIRRLQGEATPILDGDEIAIIPAMAGGQGSSAPQTPAQGVSFSGQKMTREQLLAQVKQQTRQVDIHQVKGWLDAGEHLVLVDVRERDEFAQGHIPGAAFIPRGHLESLIEVEVPDRETHVVLYCATDGRSAFAARTLQEMGYRRVEFMRGGFGAWKNAGYPYVVPRAFSDE